MKGRKHLAQFFRIFSFSIYFLCLGSLAATPTFRFPVDFWYKQGFTLPESVEIASQGAKESSQFIAWLDRQTAKKRSKIIAILITKGIRLNFTKSTKLAAKAKIETNHHHAKKEGSPNSKTNGDFFFVGGTYQVIDARYLPLEKRNHSSLFLGQVQTYGKWMVEKRDNKLTYGLEFNYKLIHAYSGHRYKPLPNFYFAKDLNFFSNFDRPDSHIPQPLNESYFMGFNLFPGAGSYKLGIYSAKTVSEEPGFYFVSPQKSLAMTFAPYSKIGSLYIHENFKNILSTDWHSNLQAEGIGRAENYLGFLYLRANSDSAKLKIDATAFRDNQLLSAPTSESVDKNGVKQDLGYSRVRYREYFAIEGLRSNEGLRYESGYAFHLPLWITEWGTIVLRYRDYTEDGFYLAHSIGRGIFYEYRNQKTIISLGSETRDNLKQAEGKVSLPFSGNYYFEISCLYRENGIPMRSWFENWSYATDFNINLVDRKEIWKLKLIGPEISLNVSISEKMDSPTYIYYANFQFNQSF